MGDKITVLKEKTYEVKGTTKLRIGDPMYFEEIAAGSDNKYLKEITFNGNISAAPLGRMKIQEVRETDGKFTFTYILVSIVQGINNQMLDVYINGRYYPTKVKKQYELGCDTAQFEMATKYGYDLFHTGADGFYGNLIVNKQHFGMILSLDFDTNLFTFDVIEKRMLKLFPERKVD